MISISECFLCNQKKKFNSTYFYDVGVYPDNYPKDKCETWIDFEQSNDGNLLWYAILEGNQYTKGHTLFIPGPFDENKHMIQIIDPYAETKKNYLESIILGINRVSIRLKTELGAENIHILCLCETPPGHLHFHLIPRYKNYDDDEKKFFICNFWEREKKRNNFTEFLNKGISHGMWYAAYHEMKFVFSEYFLKTPKQRAIELEELAKKLRRIGLKNPFPLK